MISVLRVPFFLEPDYPENLPSVGTNRERLVRKWGGEAGWEEQKRRHDLKGRGRAAGIPHFNLDRLTGNTMASHRLIQHVGRTYGLDVSEVLYDELNVYYFVDGHSLNDRPRLAKRAAERIARALDERAEDDDDNNVKVSPPSETEILDFLNGNEGRTEIDNALRTLSEMGIHSIPQFIIEGTTIVGGAADWRTFVKIFDDIEKRGFVENEGRPLFGDLLGVDEKTLLKGTVSV